MLGAQAYALGLCMDLCAGLCLWIDLCVGFSIALSLDWLSLAMYSKAVSKAWALAVVVGKVQSFMLYLGIKQCCAAAIA